jgi:hypothetical protein
MKPPTQRRLQLLQRTLKDSSFKFYLKLLSALLAEHREYEFLEDFSNALRERNFLKLMDAADSLSEQKYSDATSHFVANQFSLLVRKYPWPKSVMDLKPRDRAIKLFTVAEKRCERMNVKIKLLQIDRSRDRFRKELGIAKSWINRVLGTRPNYRAIADMADYGPGASLGVHGDATSYFRKISKIGMTVTPGAIHHGFLAYTRNYHLLESLMDRGGDGRFVCYDMEVAFATYLSRIRVVTNNKLSFVPKTAKTNRTIAVEPLLNGLFQKGIDQYMRKRLSLFNIDLSDQGKNQEFAREGSMNDSEDGFVTIDLKSASDSISTELVRSLLPDDWYRLLARTRSPCYELDKVVKAYNKFCSMGNGFCFPLESLIFASACVSLDCGSPGVDFLVYGDDLIVRKRYAKDLISLLGNWGFRVNTDKTFLEGPFRESCGRDWFGGQDVRPFTLDYALDTIQDVFKFLNLTCRNERTTKFFQSVRDMVINHIPIDVRFFRPLKGEEDSGIDSLGSEFMTAPSCHYNGVKWRWLELASRPLQDFDVMDSVKDSHLAMSDALRGAESIGYGRYLGLPKVMLRNRTQTKVVRKGYVSTSNWLPPHRH